MEVSLCSNSTLNEPNEYFSTDTLQPEFAPALSSSRALARFEFEASRGNEGTKILMVEWLDEVGDSDWQISWEGTKMIVPAKDAAVDKLLRIVRIIKTMISKCPFVNKLFCGYVTSTDSNFFLVLFTRARCKHSPHCEDFTAWTKPSAYADKPSSSDISSRVRCYNPSAKRSSSHYLG